DQSDVIRRFGADQLVQDAPFDAVIVEEDHVPFARPIRGRRLPPLTAGVAHVAEKMADRVLFLSADRNDERAKSDRKGGSAPHGPCAPIWRCSPTARGPARVAQMAGAPVIRHYRHFPKATFVPRTGKAAHVDSVDQVANSTSPRNSLSR